MKHRFAPILRLAFALMMVAPLVAGPISVSAMPASPTDETKVPHYFGPYPNWANSPLTLPDATVTITGNGTGATAVATVGANGSITGITVTNPGHDYTNARVDITGSGSGATASATIIKKGAVVAVNVTAPGAGYITPVVTFSGGGSGGGAAAIAYGGVDQVTLISGGSGYTFPTVDFDLPDAPDGVQAKGHALMDAGGAITEVVVDSPGSGYSHAPGVAILNGTQYNPINGAQLAQAEATLSIQQVTLTSFGADYNQVPTVTIADAAGSGSGATATAMLDNGIISAITVTRAGSGYITPGGIRKFVDTLPGLGPTAANNLGQYVSLASATANQNEADGWVPASWAGPAADYYWIGLVQYTEKMHSDLPASTLRGYVQLTFANTGHPISAPNQTTLNGQPLYSIDPPHYLGPTIVATKDKPVRIKFTNLLPTGSGGDLFLPVDSTVMGSGEAAMGMPFDPRPVAGGTVMDEARNPMCGEKYYDPAMRAMCFTENRATLHLHGGNTPWISDGTAHQWITPDGENTMWPKGVSAQNVPDMADPGPGSMTFYYSNQQSARLLFYHDHSWGITRLNVYAGEAAGYLITDATEQKLMAADGALAGLGVGIPLVIQDKTFVPDAAQLALQDPTWDAARWGSKGSFWYHHVYMPAQNPGDPSGMSAYGRWMYGPWFWPPAADTKYGPIANPYFDSSCNLDDPATWQYQVDPFCEPALIPGTPNISVGMEQFNDTPLVNGTAYPTVTLEPKSYRFRILSAANDRFFNLQWYVADPSTASTGLNAAGQVIGGTEVALNAAELAAAQNDPTVFPTPDTALSPAGPSWIQIGTEGGFLPAPVVVPNQPTTWITDPTRFDFGNVDKHSLLLAPAERADVVVDFSAFAGKTLILYNDSPAAFPARIACYDYYTGGPDLTPACAPTTLPGYGPNTRTIMQVKIAGTAQPAFNLSKLQAAFSHKANGSGVFESGQHPIIVGQAAYNSAYGTSFANGGWCSSPNAAIKCDGFARINQQGGDPFTFDTLRMKADGSYPAGYGKVSVKIEPKAIHDEMNAATFDEFGRMTANLGIEAIPATPGGQIINLMPFVFPTTEIIDGTNLPRADVKVTPISTGDDGTQIWKITHNGVDTHPIHFHAYDVQILNRVTWDNIIIPPDREELGWKDTLRISPLEDTIVAIRPVIPVVPFDLPNSVRLLSPMVPVWNGVVPDPLAGTNDVGVLASATVADLLGIGIPPSNVAGEPIDVYNHYVNFGEEYTYHCHILSHEEMDMMRPVSIALPPVAPSNLVASDNGDGTATLTWTDNSLSETAFVVEKSTDGGLTWAPLETLPRLLQSDLLSVLPTANTSGGTVETVDLVFAAGDLYRVQAWNTVGDTWDYANPGNEILAGGGFPTMTVKSAWVYSNVVPTPPAAPTNLVATLQAGPQVALAWTDNSSNETGFVVERSPDGVNFSVLANVGANVTGYVDATVSAGNTYVYQVAAVNGAGQSAYAVSNSVTVPAAPTAPVLNATLQNNTQVSLTWSYSGPAVTGFVLERSAGGGFSVLATLPATASSYLDTAVTAGTTYNYRVKAVNGVISGPYSNTVQVSVPSNTIPARPNNLTATNITQTTLTLNWQDNSNNELGFTIQRASNNSFTQNLQTFTVGANVTAYNDSGLTRNTTYYYRVRAFNAAGASQWSPLLRLATAR